MSFAILLAQAAGERVRGALARAVERLPAELHVCDDEERPARLRALAADPGIEWVITVDEDVLVAPDAFGGLRKALAAKPAVLGGRATIGGQPHFGAMFGPARSGPNPFELVAITGFEQRSGVHELLRGPVDVPQRGVLAVSTAFVRAIPDDVELDSPVLHLDLAVWARRLDRAVRCEPALAFESAPDGAAVQTRLLDLRRFADDALWDPSTMWRQPPGLRAYLIDRDTRAMGTFRGFQKRPLPPIESITYRSGDVARVREALARTGDRYVLLAPAGAPVARPALERLIANLERSARHALAVERPSAPFGAALFHLGRLPSLGGLTATSVDQLVAAVIEQLPARHLAAVGPRGPLLPDVLPPGRPVASIDIVFVAASQPAVVDQTLQAVLRENLPGQVSAVYSAGAETVRRTLGSYQGVRIIADRIDPILAHGLNEALRDATADVVAIVRDDVLVSAGMFERMLAAFERIPRLAAVVPRIAGADRPEGVGEIAYNSATEMQVHADRRALDHAREAQLLPFATAPLILVKREALALVGPFDVRFGLSRFGVEDLTRRLVAANALVAVADDAWAHVFAPDVVESLVAPLDVSLTAAAALRERWTGRDGFDPQRDALPFPAPSEDASGADDGERRRVLFVVESPAAWPAIEPHVRALVDVFRAADPLDVAIALGPDVALGAFAATLRDLLLAAPVALEHTVNVHVEPAADLEAWVAAQSAAVRLAAVEHPALRDVPAVDDVAALRGVVAGEAVR